MAKHNPKAPARGDIADSMNGSAKRAAELPSSQGEQSKQQLEPGCREKRQVARVLPKRTSVTLDRGQLPATSWPRCCWFP